MVNRIVVGAHYGLRDWIYQRATAVIMLLYTIIFAVVLAGVGSTSFEAWRAVFSGGFMKFMTFLFLVSLFLHAWIGIRDLWMDYIKPVGVRLALHTLTATVLVGYTGWAAKILWSL